MPFFVYILSNGSDGDLYKGFTENLEQRLLDHNSGFSVFTSTKREWRYIGIFEFSDKSEALIFERKIKRWNRRSVDKLISSEINSILKYRVS